MPIFRKFLNVLSIYFLEDHLCSFSCNSYNINKSHKLPFVESSITSSSALDVIFSNVWTSLVSSSDGFHFCVIFVDHFTKYIWFYPLRRKSNVHSTFVAFKQLVENYFTSTIKTLYTNNEGEFLVLRSFLKTHGITHLTTPPHTPEHNGYSECQHRHIVETGLTLLHQASIPLIFWSYDFAMAIYLINRMLKVGLSLGSSFEKLFHKVPKPSKLHVFVCLCFPWLRPYSSHKLDPKSSPCVFLSDSLTQSVFLCFDPTLKKNPNSKKKSLCPFLSSLRRMFSHPPPPPPPPPHPR